MAQLGCNVAGRAEYNPASVAALGAKWARCVGYRNADITQWILGCHDQGIKVLMVLARESIGGSWEKLMEGFRDRYGSLVDAWQIGNESDHVSNSSWTMVPEELNVLLRSAREVFGPDAYLVGPGLVSGQPGWAAAIDWSPVQALALHPYAKFPGTPELDNLIAGYAAYGRPLWVTEYNARTLGMAVALRDDPRLSVALAFCYSDAMVQGFGLWEDPAALADFKAAAGAPVIPPIVMPPTNKARFDQGFADFARVAPDILGQPLTNEAGFALGVSIQPTTTGVLFWIDVRQRTPGRYTAGDDLAECFGFKGNDGSLWTWRQGWDKPRRMGVAA